MAITMTQCPGCKAQMPSNYKKCAFCRHPLEPANIDRETNPSPWSGPGQYATISPAVEQGGIGS